MIIKVGATKKTVLFITYDGLLDQLGASQILPYLRAIASHQRYMHIVSFEKPARFAAGAEDMRSSLLRDGINWTPLPFTLRFGKLGKLWDLSRLYLACLSLQWQHRFDVVHCRSYLAMQVGCLLRKIDGVSAIFDMRGLWADERVDGELWTQDRWLNRLAYRYYKRVERKLLLCASHVVVLTERVIPELVKLQPNMTAPVSVIPCCADFAHFEMLTDAERLAVRSKIGITKSALVLSYLGSLGTWYMLGDMLLLFSIAARQRTDVHMLFITRDWKEEHEELIRTMNLVDLRSRIHVLSATRDEVPHLLGASDVMLSFIKPAYSKIASSPTKLAEAFAMGVPVISNVGVGDVEQITRDLDAGAVFELNDEADMAKVVANLDRIRSMGGMHLRDRARPIFGLEVAEKMYRTVYQSIEDAK